LGVIPKLSHPRHPLDTAPKGVETHPGDGRLSVGNSSLRLFTYIPCKASVAAQLAPDFQKKSERPYPDRRDRPSRQELIKMNWARVSCKGELEVRETLAPIPHSSHTNPLNSAPTAILMPLAIVKSRPVVVRFVLAKT
jgi:hypothetical protein